MSHIEIGKASTAATLPTQQTADPNTKWSHDHISHIAVHTPIQAPRCPENSQSLPNYSSNSRSPQIGIHLPAQGLPNHQSYHRSTCFDTHSRQQSPLDSHPAPDAANAAMRHTNSGMSFTSEIGDQKPDIGSFNGGNQSQWSAVDNSQKSWLAASGHQQQQSPVRPRSAQSMQDNMSSPHSQPRLLSPQAMQHSYGFQSLPTSTVFGSQNHLTGSSPIHAASSVGIATPQPIRSQLASPANSNETPMKCESVNVTESSESDEPRFHTILDYAVENEMMELSSSSANINQPQMLDETEASKLLLNFSQNNTTQAQSNASTVDVTNLNGSTASTAESIVSDVVESLAADRAHEDANGNTNSVSVGNNGQQRSRPYFRPPGLEAPKDGEGPTDSNVRVCRVCGFSCTSKFHYNSHMNTHGDHQCSMCNYTSRTEGRLRNHMKVSHTREQRIEAGLDVDPEGTMSTSAGSNSAAQNRQNNLSRASHESNTANHTFQMDGAGHISTTMSSIMDIVNRAAAATSSMSGSTSTSTDTFFNFLDNYNGQALSDGTSGLPGSMDPGSSSLAATLSNMPLNALDQIRALTERTSIASSQQNGGSIQSTLNGLFGIGNQQMPMHSNEEMISNFSGEGDIMHTNGGPAVPVENGQNKQEQTPRRAGRPKTYKCKQCHEICRSKEEHWTHLKMHIPKEKQLTCPLPNCGFVTEYKHHLDLKMHLRKYNHKRKPGTMDTDSHDDDFVDFGRPESDDSTTHSLQQLAERLTSEQYNNAITSSNEKDDSKGDLKPTSEADSTTHPTLNSMLLQPIVTSASMQQYAFMRHQQHMNELIRAANPNIIACNQCDFTATSQQPGQLSSEILNNNGSGVGVLAPALDLATQLQHSTNPLQEIVLRAQADESRRQVAAAFANNIAAQNATTNPVINGTRDHSENGNHLLNNLHNTQQIHPNRQDYIGHIVDVAGDEEHSPTAGSAHEDSVESSASPNGSKISADGCTSSGSPSSGSSRKRKQSKTIKVDQISVKLQGKCSPDAKRIDFGDYNGHKGDSLGTAIITTLPQPIPSLGNNVLDTERNGENGNLSNLLARLNQIQEQQRQQTMPYTCQHCMMAFQDRALYQIHLGYHGYETPFKCNRCGHLSSSSLEFNLHLYQAKHD
ncbi:DNA-binding protein Ikaro [Ditylenchus destructor]|nr:DNA-binding protein Ikaro [Ditylenchus destructor]